MSMPQPFTDAQVRAKLLSLWNQNRKAGGAVWIAAGPMREQLVRQGLLENRRPYAGGHAIWALTAIGRHRLVGAPNSGLTAESPQL